MKRATSREAKFQGKQRVVRRNVAKEELEAAAKAARYAPSNYHCKINGVIARRVKPATPCPRDFSLQEAGDAMRRAILSGRVSKKWIEGFPKHIWHKVGDVWYEGCTEVGTLGTYHAYPIDTLGLPPGIR